MSSLSYELDIEESERTIGKGILCLVRSDGKRLYVKPVSHKGGFLELVPLTKAEMIENNIEESEHIINDQFDISVEESESEPEKKPKAFNLNDPSDMAKAAKIAQERLTELQQKEPKTWKVPSDTDQQVANSVRKAIFEKYAALGLECPSLETEDDILKSAEIIKALQTQKLEVHRLQSEIPAPSGSAPLNEQQLHGSKAGYESVEEMIKDLRVREHSSDSTVATEAKAIIRKLFEKTVAGMKEQNSTEILWEKVNPKSEEKSNARSIEVPLESINSEGQPSEIEKWTKKRKRKDD